MGMDGSNAWSDRSIGSASTEADVCVSHDDIALRAATDADMDFLRKVFASTRMHEFVNAGMPVEQAEALLASQFPIQHAYYRQHYPHGRFDVIMQGARSIGRLYHDWQGDVVQLIDIALLPAYRGKGIGTCLMRAIVAEAARKHMPMRLYVEFDNPVRTLYRAFGFAPAGENGVYELMYRNVMPFDDKGAWAPVKGLNDRLR